MRNVVKLLIVFISCHPTYSYQFTEDFNLGIYWSQLPIRFAKVAANTVEGRQLDSLVSKAEEEWEDVIGVEIWDAAEEHYIGSAPTANVIRWSNNFAAETGFSPDSTLAVTIRYRVGTFFDHFEIILNGENQVLRQNFANMLHQVLLHELGHVLGIGHSERSPAVMEANLRGYNELKDDDSSAASAVYTETIRRQDTGFISPLSTKKENETNALACGTIDMTSPPSGPGLFQVMLGFLLSFLLFANSSRQKMPTHG